MMIALRSSYKNYDMNKAWRIAKLRKKNDDKNDIKKYDDKQEIIVILLKYCRQWHIFIE